MDNRLSTALIEFYEKLSSWEHSVAGQVRLTPQQCHVVAMIGEDEGTRMRPLADKLGITTGTLTVMIDRLQQAGLVERKDDPDDRRATRIVLTAKGRKAHQAHEAHHHRLAEEISSSMSDSERESFLATIEKILTIL